MKRKREEEERAGEEGYLMLFVLGVAQARTHFRIGSTCWWEGPNPQMYSKFVSVRTLSTEKRSVRFKKLLIQCLLSITGEILCCQLTLNFM